MFYSHNIYIGRSLSPSSSPVKSPARASSASPSSPSLGPSTKPSLQPTTSSLIPSISPSFLPTSFPSSEPTLAYPYNGKSTYILYPTYGFLLGSCMTVASVVTPVTQLFEPSVVFSIGTLVPPAGLSLGFLNSSAGSGNTNEFILSQSRLYIYPDGVLTFEDRDTSGSGVYTSATFKIPMYTATHIAFVKNKTVGSFYLNGVLSLQIKGMRSSGYGGAFLCFGQDYLTNSSFYRGYQDNIYVSMRALDLNQIGRLIGNIYLYYIQYKLNE